MMGHCCGEKNIWRWRFLESSLEEAIEIAGEEGSERRSQREKQCAKAGEREKQNS